MKKKIVIIISCVIVCFFVILLVALLINTAKKDKESMQEKRIIPTTEKKTITCTKKKDSNGVIEEESVYLENSVLITRTNTSTWSDGDDQTCKYYTHKSEGLNPLEGITSMTECNGQTGSSTTIYTIAELNKEMTKLKQFDYINENNIFDYNRWKNYMKDNHYTCHES